jgi:hypothetical protein
MKKAARRKYIRLRNSLLKKLVKTAPEPGEEIDVQTEYATSSNVYGVYNTLDPDHRDDISGTVRRIINYVNDPQLRRPLNILMYAAPGSGKSHLVKCICDVIDGVEPVTYNMSGMSGTEDLLSALDTVRNIKALDKSPLLFLDEFDSKNGAHFPLLLPLLWDGELRIGHRDLKLGKLVIVMAGSSRAIEVYAVGDTERKVGGEGESAHVAGPEKLDDLLSRINGGTLTIPSLNKRPADKVCISLALLEHRFGATLQTVPWYFLSFIAQCTFHHGVRSLTHLIDLIPRDDSVGDGLAERHFRGLKAHLTADLLRSGLRLHLSAGGDGDVAKLWKSCRKYKNPVRFQEEPLEEEEDEI